MDITTKDIYETHKREIDIITENIENSNTIIDDDSRVDVIKEIEIDERGNINILRDYSDEHLLSLISIIDRDNPTFNTNILSINRISQIFINFKHLHNMRFNEYFYNRLHQLKKDEYNLHSILNLLYSGFSYYIDRDIVERFGDFSSFNYIKKIKILKEVIEISNKKYSVEKQYIIYHSTPILYTYNLKKDIENRYPNSLSSIYLLHLLGSEKSRKHSINFKTEVGDRYRLNKKGLSRSQAMIVNESTNRYSSILGIGGSGKTFLASHLIKFNSLISAIYYANRRVGLPQFFTSYSPSSITNIIENFRKHSDISYILHLDSFDEIYYKNQLENRYRDIDEEIDIERLTKLDNYFKDEFQHIYLQLERAQEIDRRFKELNSKLISIQEKRAFKTVIKILKREREVRDFWYKLVRFINSLLDNEIDDSIVLKQDIINFLKPYIDIKSVIKDDEIEELYHNILSIYKDIVEYHKNSLHQLKDIDCNLDNIEIDIDSIDDDDLDYYLRYSFKLYNRDIDFKNVINYLQSRSITKDGDSSLIKNIDYDRLMSILFPVMVSPIYNLSTFYSGDFYASFCDEAFLVPSYLFYHMANRSCRLYLFGDMNQLNLEYFCNNNEIKRDIEILFNKNKMNKEYSLYIDKHGQNKTIFDIVYSIDKDISVTIDNFRSYRDIVYSQIKMNPQYLTYLETYIKKHSNIEVNSIDDYLELLDIYNSSQPLYKIGEKEYNSSLLYIDNRDLIDNRIKMFVELFDRYSMENMLIVTLFKERIKDIRMVVDRYRGDRDIYVKSVDSIQSHEYDMVLFESDCEKIDDVSYNYIIENPRILNVIIGRTKKCFILSISRDVVESSTFLSELIIDNRFLEIRNDNGY